jgi:hypothetical protein
MIGIAANWPPRSIPEPPATRRRRRRRRRRRYMSPA